MKKYKYLIGSVLIFLLSASILIAQDTEIKYYSLLQNIQVQPQNSTDYLALEKAWKKIHEENIKAGKYLVWELTMVLSPMGAQTDHNYATRIVVAGEDQLAAIFEGNFMPKKWQSLLTESELKLVNKTDALRTIVSTDVWESLPIGVFSPDAAQSTIQVLNTFKLAKGKSIEDHLQVEQDIWKPVHEARLKDGLIKGWGMHQRVLPIGTDLPYQIATADLYQDMKSFFKHHNMNSFTNYFSKVHSEKDINSLIEKTANTVTLATVEIRRILDHTSYPQPENANE